MNDNLANYINKLRVLRVFGFLAVCFILHFFVSLHFSELVLLGHLVRQLNSVGCLCHCKDVDGSLVGGAGDPAGVFVERYRVDLRLVRSSPHLLQWRTILSREDSYQCSLVTSSG